MHMLLPAIAGLLAAVVAPSVYAQVNPFAPHAVPAGPIWDQADAEQKCPALALTEKSVWTGQWWTTIPGSMSVCELIPAVMIQAWGSNGQNTGTCVFSNTGGYYLEACDSGRAAQLFAFDTNGPGHPIRQRRIDGTGNLDECLTVPVQVAPWAAGTWVARRPCNGTDYTSKLWRWTNGVNLLAVDSPQSETCLVADGITYLPPRLILGSCTDPQRTQWSVIIAK